MKRRVLSAVVFTIAAFGLYLSWMAYDSVYKETGAVSIGLTEMVEQRNKHLRLAEKYPTHKQKIINQEVGK